MRDAIRLGLGTLILVAAGCGEPGGQAEVWGAVRLDGQPMTSGSVTFVGADGTKSNSGIGPKGEYRVRGVVRGKALIAVESHPRVPPGLMKPGPAGPPPPKGDSAPAIPARYKSPEASGLSCDVRGARQEHDIDLMR